MGNLLFYDTETTGLPLWDKPSDWPQQPHLCQLTAFPSTDEGERLGSMDVIIRPEGWDIPGEMTQIHGISQEKAMDCGVPEGVALLMFRELWKRAGLRIAHNHSFDNRVLRIAHKRYYTAEEVDEWKAGPSFCTMHQSTKIIKLPPTSAMVASGRGNFKPPTLKEAFEFFTGQQFPADKQHNAMYDVLAMKKVYFEIIKRVAVQVQEEKPKGDGRPDPDMRNEPAKTGKPLDPATLDI